MKLEQQEIELFVSQLFQLFLTVNKIVNINDNIILFSSFFESFLLFFFSSNT